MNGGYKNLLVWRKSIELSSKIYKITTGFPKEEIYGITNQIRRCSVSIPSNIAEGYGRNGEGEYKQFLGISRGSSNELETQLIIANNIGYLDNDSLEEILKLLSEIQKILYTLINKTNKYEKK
ncbi:MAG: four helix bundle protein [Candidatus Gracilibacteria bacterium]|nr:four helix bundle protein [Candidatus Gracilibacteria bacterium]